MNILSLSWHNLKAKPLNTFLSLILFALGVGLISLLILLTRQVSDKMNRNIKNVNLVIGAKGSPLQMILSSVYHVDVPTGNIPLRQGEAIRRIKGLIERAIPQALGDSYEQFRIVGTNHDYPDLYEAKIAQGKIWEEDLECTIGDYVAKKTGLKVGDHFYGAHGLVQSVNADVHKSHAYTVTGIFEKTGTVVDQLIMTNVASVWRVHEGHHHDEDGGEEHHDEDEHHDADAHDADHHDAHDADHHEGEDHDADEHHDEDHHDADHDEDHDHEEALPRDSLGHLIPVDTAGKAITSYLIIYKKDPQGNPSSMADIMLPKIIDENFKAVGYAYPLREIKRLVDLTGLGLTALYALAFTFVLVSFLSVFISLYNSLKERRYELALMRVMGGSRARLFTLIITEGLLISILGYMLGILLSHGGMTILASMLQDSYQYQFNGFWYFLTEEVWLFVGSLFVGFLAAAIPAIQAYRTDISKTLANA